jgi:hypothetical protein
VRTGSSFCSIYQPAPVSEKKEFEMPIPKVTSRQLLAHITKMLSLNGAIDAKELDDKFEVLVAHSFKDDELKGLDTL